MREEGVHRNPETQRLTMGYFVGGIIHACAQRRGGTFDFNVADPALHQAFKTAYDLTRDADGHTINVRFALAIGTWGVSPALEAALSNLLYVYRQPTVEGVGGSFTNLRYHADSPTVEDLLEKLPGSPELYNHLASITLAAYDETTAAQPAPTQ